MLQHPALIIEAGGVKYVALIPYHADRDALLVLIMGARSTLLCHEDGRQLIAFDDDTLQPKLVSPKKEDAVAWVPEKEFFRIGTPDQGARLYADALGLSDYTLKQMLAAWRSIKRPARGILCRRQDTHVAQIIDLRDITHIYFEGDTHTMTDEKRQDHQVDEVGRSELPDARAQATGGKGKPRDTGRRISAAEFARRYDDGLKDIYDID